MINFLFLNKILIVLVLTFGIYLAFWVYFANRRSKTNQLFALMMLLALFWITLCYLSGISTENLELSLLLGRLAYGIAILFFIPFYFFFIRFIGEKREFLFLKILIPSGSLIIFFLSVFTDFMAKEMVPATFVGVPIGVVPVLGRGSFIYFGFVFFVAVFVLFLLIKRYLKSLKIEKIKLQYFLFGILIFVIANLVFNVILAFWQRDARYYQIGNYSVIFLLGFTAYAIVKRELFDIKVVLTQILVGAIAILLLVNVIGSEALFEYIWKGALFGVFLIFGWLLIKSVLKEIKYREEIRKAYEVEKKAHKELKKLDEAKTQFMMATQHHLRTPLTSMRGYLDLILGGSYGKLRNKKIKEKLKRLEISSKRLAKVINELLDISQFQLGKEVVNLQPNIQIEPILKEIMEELIPEAEKKKIYLKLEKPGKKLPSIKADLEKLKVALTNIVDNGIKYTDKGGVTIKLKIENYKLKIVIEDTGMGIDKEELKALFIRTFERGEQAKKVYTTGRGIGLYIASQIIEAHNGKIWAESEGIGKGSVFYVELPVG